MFGLGWGVWGRGGEMGRGENGPLPLLRCITITVSGAQKIAKKTLELNLQVKQINIARSAKVVLHKLPGKSSLNVSFLFPIFPAYGHHNHHDRVRFPKKCLQLGQFGPPAPFVVFTPIYGVTTLC